MKHSNGAVLTLLGKIMEQGEAVERYTHSHHEQHNPEDLIGQWQVQDGALSRITLLSHSFHNSICVLGGDTGMMPRIII